MIRALGATPVLESDEDSYKSVAARFDLILPTVPTGHKIDPLLPLLKHDAAFVAVGDMPDYNHAPQIMGRKSIAGSLISGIPETQKVLDFCGQHGIVPDTKTIARPDINDAYKALKEGDVEGRFVIVLATLMAEAVA